VVLTVKIKACDFLLYPNSLFLTRNPQSDMPLSGWSFFTPQFCQKSENRTFHDVWTGASFSDEWRYYVASTQVVSVSCDVEGRPLSCLGLHGPIISAGILGSRLTFCRGSCLVKLWSELGGLLFGYLVCSAGPRILDRQ